ncbi:LuxR C-terminal-related transcriptional regulator [Nocardia mangyaensis]|uniref:LuxR C-terminal-related transcriptional regulator n=1 Tax=Nocardia mangyaensis TaxID=2213200 RepID=UPI00267625F7|nr:LuxR C-terminal-related transcriptional regulator [Nocardia mangyaensis]MDO3651088.1 LuxR C-terminal-related transcriptional regulator [Nocardia mangyaensis]
MADISLDTFPNGRTIFRALDTVDQQPVLLLIRGRSGTGKTFLLNAVRTHLRNRGIQITDSVRDLDDGDGVLVADNVHSYSDDDLRTLCAAIESGRRSVVLTTQPRPHDTRLRALADAVSRHGRTVDLRALGSADTASFARELGMAVSPPLALHIHQLTAGIPGGVIAALSAARTVQLANCVAAVEAAVTAWARTLLDTMEPDLLDTLVIAATGTGLDATELTEILGVDLDSAHDLIDRARAGALVTDADLLLAPAVGPLRILLGDRRYVEVQRRLLAARLDAGLLRDCTALFLAESGVVDARLAEFLCRTAEKSGEAARYYAAAAAAGAPVESIAVRWAEAAARAGDSGTALRLVEPLLTADRVSTTELVAAVRISASVLTRRGLVGRAAGLYRWLGPERIGADWAPAAMVLTMAGDIAGATRMAEAAQQWPPTETDAGPRLIVSAFDDSLDPHGAGTGAAISALIQAVNSDDGDDRYLPCTALSVATLLCLGTGEPGRAGDALRRAAGKGANRQLPILTAWTALLGGDERHAASTLAAIDIPALEPREQLLAHALSVGLARRSGDHAALVRAWQAACPLFDELDADLLSLLPIGELWLAGIRLRDVRRIEPLVDAARALLRAVGRAPAWTNSFHWYGVQAALAGESPRDLLPHAHALKTAAAAGDRQAAALADAGRTWVLVLRGQVDAAEVQAAVSSLAELGLTWDAARLASEAALAVGDSATATTLLKLARSVRARSQPVEQPLPAARALPQTPQQLTPPPEGSVALSDREREVAELVLLGLTYREIGARLYISAKTVEHHVARIRRRIGARSRSELLSMLRAMGHGSLLV